MFTVRKKCNELTLGMSNFAYKADDCNQQVGIALALFWNIAASEIYSLWLNFLWINLEERPIWLSQVCHFISMKGLKVKIWVPECTFFCLFFKAKVKWVLEISKYILNITMLMPFIQNNQECIYSWMYCSLLWQRADMTGNYGISQEREC